MVQGLLSRRLAFQEKNKNNGFIERHHFEIKIFTIGLRSLGGRDHR